jgi:hypothetical protein
MDGARMSFCEDEVGMWRWLLCAGSGQSLLRSREAFSSLDLCRKDAMQELRGLISAARTTSASAENEATTGGQKE